MFNMENDQDVFGIGEYTENELLEYFGNTHLMNAIHILATRTVTTKDAQLIHEALCIVVSMYVTKYQKGEIEKDAVLH